MFSLLICNEYKCFSGIMQGYMVQFTIMFQYGNAVTGKPNAVVVIYILVLAPTIIPVFPKCFGIVFT